MSIHSEIPSGCGMGSSTASVVAAIRDQEHRLRAAAVPGGGQQARRRAETASDPLAYGCTPVLLAHVAHVCSATASGASSCDPRGVPAARRARGHPGAARTIPGSAPGVRQRCCATWSAV
ncbi:hypothetical protein QJS66_06970 [Kocuria rhizophila]|nr:hypothetical protein QJS66_06970 [Kocuria rhizophila]